MADEKGKPIHLVLISCFRPEGVTERDKIISYGGNRLSERRDHLGNIYFFAIQLYSFYLHRKDFTFER